MAGSDEDRRDGTDQGRPEPVDGVPAARGSWFPGARLLAAAAVLVLALGALAVVLTLANPDRLGVAFSGGRDGAPTVPVWAEPGGTGVAGNATEATAEGALTAPLAGRRHATFELVDGVTTLRLRAADLGDELYRISSPADAGVVPRPDIVGDRVRLRVEQSGRPGPGVVDVVLNTRPGWRLRLLGGVTEHRLDLTGARLAGVDLVGGATRVDLRLPVVTGSLTVRMTGGVNRFAVHVPGAPPVRVRVASGAGGLTLYGDRRDGIAAGELISSPNWDRTADRVYLDLVGGAGAVTVADD